MLDHLLISICLQAFIGAATGNWWAGAAVCAALWIGREQAQAEYRWIAQHGGKRENLCWWNTLEPAVWNFHNAFWNLALPIAMTAAIALVIQLCEMS
jgi:hypothetical protein